MAAKKKNTDVQNIDTGLHGQYKGCRFPSLPIHSPGNARSGNF